MPDHQTASALAEEIGIYSAQLKRHTLNAAMGGPEIGVRVKDPDFLADLLDRAAAALRSPAAPEAGGDAFDVLAHLRRQREWSERTFGPGDRTKGVIDHIRKELREIEAEPGDLTEWIDVVILAFDGAWRAGFSPEEIVSAWRAKQAKNEARQWPDWRTAPADKAIEHARPAPAGDGVVVPVEAMLLASVNEHNRLRSAPQIASVEAMHRHFADPIARRWLDHERRRLEAALQAAARPRPVSEG